MKRKNKYLLLLILLLVICSGLVTYALFRTNKSGNANVNAARWNVVFKNGESEIENNFNIQLSNAEWTNPLGNVASGKIAPGSQATFYITIDATNTETDVYYEAVIGDSFNDPDFEVTVGEDSGVISYSTTSGAMVKQIPITVVWNGNINDSETKNSDDLLKKAQNITIPVTITAAQKLALKYTVTFNDGLGNTILIKKVNEGEAIGDLPADPTREKYVFLGWYDDIENGNEVTAETIATSGMNIYAHWEQWRGRIPVVSDSSLAQEAYDGDLTTYASMTRDSWRYLKLPNDAEEYKINIVFSAAKSTGTGFGIAFFDENKQVIEPKYVYTSNGQGGNGFIALGQLLTTQQTCTLLIPPNTSYLGLEKVDCANNVYVYDIYLSEKEDVTISFNTHDVNVPAPQSIQIKEGNNISSIPTISRPGYYFEGWYTLENGGEKLTTNTLIMGNTEYHARYIEKVTVSFDSNGGSTVSPITVRKGSTLDEIPTSSLSGYGFLGWYDSNDNILTSSTIINDNITYTARWVDGRIIPVVSESTLGADAYDGDLTTYGNTNRGSWLYLKLPSYANDKKINVVYKAQSSSYSDIVFAFFDDNKQLISQQYEYHQGTAGTANSGCTYMGYLSTDLTTSKFIIPANASYFGVIRYDTNAVSSVYDVYLSEKEDVTISFNTHDVNVPAPQSIQIKEGNNISNIPTISKAGYYFVGWYSEETGGEKLTTSTQIISNIEYHARFSEIVTVTFDSNGGSSVSPINAGKGYTLDEIPTCTLSGYEFVGWYDSNNNKLTTSTIINNDITYTAKWGIDIPVSQYSTLGVNAYDGDLTTYVNTNRGSWLYLKLPNNAVDKKLNVVYKAQESKYSDIVFAFFDDNKQLISQQYEYHQGTAGTANSGCTYMGYLSTDLTTSEFITPSNASYFGVIRYDTNAVSSVYDVYLVD